MSQTRMVLVGWKELCLNQVRRSVLVPVQVDDPDLVPTISADGGAPPPQWERDCHIGDTSRLDTAVEHCGTEE